MPNITGTLEALNVFSVSANVKKEVNELDIDVITLRKLFRIVQMLQ